MELDESYEGREHSAAKHELLKGYLEKLLYIVGVSGIKEITYVDCFSGPWGDASGDLHGTSIAISLDIINRVHEGLVANNMISDIKFRAIFVEENKGRYSELRAYLDHNCPSYVECHALHGDYSKLQGEILRKCGNGFSFFFIDPEGWTDVSLPRLSQLLQRPNSEYLITFMYDFLNRFIPKDQLREPVSRLLGEIDDEFLSELQDMDPKQREKVVVRRYRSQLMSFMGDEAGHHRSRSFHATILNKDKNKTIYHMVYLTRHPKGIVEFSKISKDVAIFQQRIRFERNDKATGQLSLIAAEDEDFQNEIAADIEGVKNFWLAHLTNRPQPYTESDLADWPEKTGWLEYDFQQAFNVLRKEKQVENLDDTANRRRKRFVHFEKSDRLRKCS